MFRLEDLLVRFLSMENCVPFLEVLYNWVRLGLREKWKIHFLEVYEAGLQRQRCEDHPCTHILLEIHKEYTQMAIVGAGHRTRILT